MFGGLQAQNGDTENMRLVYDRNKIQESVDAKGYDDRNLTICKCGKHRYPSKLMFIRFLEQFADVKGVADIWSESDLETGKVKIHVEVTYKVFKDQKKAKERRQNRELSDASAMRKVRNELQRQKLC